MTAYLLSLAPYALLFVLAIGLFVILVVLYLLARIFFGPETASGVAVGIVVGMLVGVPVGLICQIIAICVSRGEMFFSWMPFVCVWAVTVLVGGIVGGIRKN